MMMTMMCVCGPFASQQPSFTYPSLIACLYGLGHPAATGGASTGTSARRERGVAENVPVSAVDHLAGREVQAASADIVAEPRSPDDAGEGIAWGLVVDTLATWRDHAGCCAVRVLCIYQVTSSTVWWSCSVAP